MAENSFHIGSRMANKADVSQNWMFQVRFPLIAKVIGSSNNDEELTLRCTSVTLPAQQIEAIESVFMGTKQFFPGKKTMGGTFSCTFYETNDQIISSSLYAWSQNLFNYNAQNVENGGKSSYSNKSQFAIDAYVDMFKYNGEKQRYGIRLVNCWLQNVDGASLNWTGNEVINYTATFQCDYWMIVSKDNDLKDPIAG